MSGCIEIIPSGQGTQCSEQDLTTAFQLINTIQTFGQVSVQSQHFDTVEMLGGEAMLLFVAFPFPVPIYAPGIVLDTLGATVTPRALCAHDPTPVTGM